MQPPVAHRCGWVAPGSSRGSVAHATSAAGLVPSGDRDKEYCFEPSPAGGWILHVPIEGASVSSDAIVLDKGPDGIRLTFGEATATRVVPWPSGVAQTQMDACTARFSKRRGELVVSVPTMETETLHDAAVMSPGKNASLDFTAAPGNEPSVYEKPCEIVASSYSPLAAGSNRSAAPPVGWRPDNIHRAGNTADPATPVRSSQFSNMAEQDFADFTRNLKVPSNPIPGRSDLKTSTVGHGFVDESGMMIIHSAASCGDVVLLTKLLDSRVDVDAKDELGATVLEKACVGAHDDAVAVLLRRGADANGVRGGPSTPLHRAAAVGGVRGQRIIDMLLAQRADCGALDQQGRTAAEVARASNLIPQPELLYVKGR